MEFSTIIKPKLIQNTVFCKKCRCLSFIRDPHAKHRPYDLPIELLQSYVFEELIGIGAFGAVFKCWDAKLEMNLAIKIMFDIDEFADMDSKIMRLVNHQYIIKYYGEGMNREEGWAFLSMELAEMDLKKAIEKNVLDNEEKKLLIFKQICEAVAYLHCELERPIIHRDLKPQNILLIRGKPRITDFGISIMKRSSDPEQSSTVSKDPGTDCYMPPELLGRKGSNFSTNDKHDIWSLGIILHEIFTGENPFKFDEFWNENICCCRYKINYSKIKEDSQVDKIMKGCLKKDPKQRLQINDILSYLEGNRKEYEQSLKPILIIEEEKEIKQIENSPLSKPSLNPQELIRKLQKIIDDLNDNKSYSIYYNKSEYERTGIHEYLNEEDISPECSLDEIIYCDEGVVLANLNLGTCDLEILISLSQSISSTNASLESLHLENNHLGDGDVRNVEYISKFISSNRKIMKLYLEDNHLGDGNEKNVELILNSLTMNINITSLHIENNHLGEGDLKNVELIANFISSNWKINALFFENNHLGDGKIENIELIMTSIPFNSSIKILNLENNHLGNGNENNIKLMFNMIDKKTSISELHLDSNNLGKGNVKNVELIMKSIQSKLNNLYLKDNHLGDGYFKNIAVMFELIKSDNKINCFNLENNHLGDGNLNNVKFICNSFDLYWQKKKLNLEKNHLGDGNSRNIELLANLMSSCSDLLLQNNNLGDGNFENIYLIVSSILANKNYKSSLNLKKNYLGKGNVKNLELISRLCVAPKELYLGDNDFGNGNIDNVELIAQSIASNQQIEYLNLENNHLGDGNPINASMIAQSITLKKEIKILNLQNNHFGDGNSANLKLIASSNSMDQYNNSHLENNHLGDGSFENSELIATFISSFWRLSSLYLERNGLGDGNIKNVESIFNSLTLENPKSWRKISKVFIKNRNGWRNNTDQKQLLDEAIQRKDQNDSFWN